MSAEFIPHSEFTEYPLDEMRERANTFYSNIKRRRTIREFSDRPVPRDIIETCLLAAGTAPSGANLQPWQFVVIEDSEIKQKIKEAAEEEERAFYNGKAPKEWLDALAPLGTDEHKDFLTIAPYIIAVFAKSHDMLEDGRRVQNYYVKESVGLATGTLITALHHCGLASLTHTPSPMGFISKILGRPKNEKVVMLLVVGYPADDCEVPTHAKQKKSLNEIATFI
ncbi:MAG: nitroreductase family protein [Chloroflexota bacterium]